MKNLIKVAAVVFLAIGFTSCESDDLNEVNDRQSEQFDQFIDRLKSAPSNDGGNILVTSAIVTRSNNPEGSFEPFTYTYNLVVDLSGLTGPFDASTTVGDVMLLNQEDDRANISSDGLLVQRDQLNSGKIESSGNSYVYEFGSQRGEDFQWKFLKVVVDNLNGERSSIKVPVVLQ